MTTKKKFKFAALDGKFLLIALVGLIVTSLFLYPTMSEWFTHEKESSDSVLGDLLRHDSAIDYAVSFTVASLIVFFIMLIASFVSTTYADSDELFKLEGDNQGGIFKQTKPASFRTVSKTVTSKPKKKKSMAKSKKKSKK